MYTVFRASGVDIETPFLLNTDSDGPLQLVNDDGSIKKVEIERTLERAKQAQANIVLVVLSKQDVPTYNAVKRAGDVVVGISTVCVVDDFKKFSKPGNVQYHANVASKFNLKLGGSNQGLEPSKLGLIDEGKTMVVGLDVTHPSPGSTDTAPSVAAIVASTDKYLAQFPAELSVQERRREMISDVGRLLKGRLTLWQRHNRNQLPENILVYRDGV
jgi:eukaryotic translation initiation factor 2C